MMSDIPILLRLASLEDDLRQSKYAPFSENPRDVVKDAHEAIRQLRIEVKKAKAQLASRNQAAEAMGVLEEMLRDEQGDMRQLDIYYHPNAGYSVILTHANREELADGYSDSLIEAVLKAGGESQ